MSEAPPCIACGRPLEGATYTGDCLTACNEECYEAAHQDFLQGGVCEVEGCNGGPSPLSGICDHHEAGGA